MGLKMGSFLSIIGPPTMREMIEIMPEAKRLASFFGIGKVIGICSWGSAAETTRNRLLLRTVASEAALIQIYYSDADKRGWYACI